MRLMLNSLTFIVLLFHFCPIYLKKNLISVYNSLHLNQKGKKKVRKGTDYRERAGRKKGRRRRKKKKKEEERRRRRRKRDLGGLDWTTGGGRNSGQRLESNPAETGRNFTRGGMGGCLVPV